MFCHVTPIRTPCSRLLACRPADLICRCEDVWQQPGRTMYYAQASAGTHIAESRPEHYDQTIAVSCRNSPLETNTMHTDDGWRWPPEMDAIQAAPHSHKMLFENGDVRVLEVIIPPGEREPVHTHCTPSVMIVDGPAMIRYYQGRSASFFFSSRRFGAGNGWTMDGIQRARMP